MPYFIVINEQGPAWDPDRPMRQQDGWDEHGAFMDALAAQGFVVLGGPFREGKTHRARLIVKAVDEQEVRSRLAPDPWLRQGILRTVGLERWEVLLGGRD